MVWSLSNNNRQLLKNYNVFLKKTERVVDRSHLTAAAAERVKVVKEAAAAARLAQWVNACV